MVLGKRMLLAEALAPYDRPRARLSHGRRHQWHVKLRINWEVRVVREDQRNVEDLGSEQRDEDYEAWARAMNQLRPKAPHGFPNLALLHVKGQANFTVHGQTKALDIRDRVGAVGRRSVFNIVHSDNLNIVSRLLKILQHFFKAVRISTDVRKRGGLNEKANSERGFRLQWGNVISGGFYGVAQ